MFLDSFDALFGNVLVGLWVALTLITAFIGIWALFLPMSFVAWSERLSVWVEMGRSQNRSAHEVNLEKSFYRYHLITGPLIIIGTLFVFYQIIFDLNPAEIKRLFVTGKDVLSVWVEVLVDAAFGWLYLSSIFAMLIGIIVTLRPSYLKGMERKANIWIETRDLSSAIDKRNDFLDKWVCAHPRWFGILALSGSLIVAYLMMRLGYLA
jgi:hypothetical protein